MKDTVAGVVADRVADLVAELESHGLRRFSILDGIEAGLKREREKDAKRPATD